MFETLYYVRLQAWLSSVHKPVVWFQLFSVSLLAPDVIPSDKDQAEGSEPSFPWNLLDYYYLLFFLQLFDFSLVSPFLYKTG